MQMQTDPSLKTFAPFLMLALLVAGACEKGQSAEPGAAAPASDPADTPAPPDTAEQPDTHSEAPEAGAILSKASFEETVNDHFEDVSDCYIEALAEAPELAGTLDLEFTINLKGQVASVTLVEDSSLSDPALLACVEAAAQAWAFDSPTQEMSLRYPFQLAPG